MQSQYYANHPVTELVNLDAKFNYIAAEKLYTFYKIVNPILINYNCNEDSPVKYIKNLDSVNIARCAGIYELATIDAIEQLF